MTTDHEQPLPPLRTRLQPFLDDVGSSRSAVDEPLSRWRAALKAAGPFVDPAAGSAIAVAITARDSQGAERGVHQLLRVR